MKQLLPNLAIILSLLITPALGQTTSPEEGRWHTPDAEGTVEIKVVDGVLSGELVASTNERARLGTVILRDFVRKDDSWKGKLYAPKRDKLLNAALSLRGDELVIRVSAGLRGKTIIWTRTE